MATILDIAEKAGVSYSAVAAALRGQGAKRRIAAATCERILRIASEMDYQPNTLASSLRTGKSKRVGIISRSQPRFHVQRTRAAASTFIEAGYRVLLQDLSWRPESEATLIREAIGEQVQGLLLESGTAATPADESMQVLAELAKRRFPLVRIDAEKGLPIDVVSVDREKGAFMATSHLLKLGHRRIGLLVDKNSKEPALRARVQGFSRAHHEWGIELGDKQFFNISQPPMADTQAEYDCGYRVLGAVIGNAPRLSAVIAGNDYIAIGLINAAIENGLSVPDDLAVMGFGSYEQAGLCCVPLTTVAYPFEELARHGAALLMERIDGLKAKPRKILIDPELIVRTSCGDGGNSAERGGTETAGISEMGRPSKRALATVG